MKADGNLAANAGQVIISALYPSDDRLYLLKPFINPSSGSMTLLVIDLPSSRGASLALFMPSRLPYSPSALSFGLSWSANRFISIQRKL